MQSIYTEENLQAEQDELIEQLKKIEKQMNELPDERELLLTSDSVNERKPPKEDRKDIANFPLNTLAEMFLNDTRDKYHKNQNLYQLDPEWLKLFTTGAGLEKLDKDNT